MSTLKVILEIVKALVLVLTLTRDEKLKREGEARLNAKILKDNLTIKERAHEIDLNDDLTDDDREWLSQFERKEKQ